MRTVAALTTSRADWSHLRWPLEEIRAHPGLRLHLIAAASHLAPEFGQTASEIEAEGFSIDHRVESLLSSDSDLGSAKTIGLLALSLADHLAALRPDILLLIADRYEMLAPASVALALRVPVAHIEGGEISLGAIDDAVRHALTKLSHLHLTPTERARKRVIGLGEEPWRVHCVGAPSLDQMRRAAPLERASLERMLELALDPAPLVVAHHPTTLDLEPGSETDALVSFLEEIETPIVCCFPNADAGSRRIIDHLRALAARKDRMHVRVNLPAEVYLNLLRHARAMLGNSSSGIMESASFELPTINIGRRQEGRERPANIIDVPATLPELRAAWKRAEAPSFREGLRGLRNPYGDGRASERIARILADAPGREQLLRKAALPAP